MAVRRDRTIARTVALAASVVVTLVAIAPAPAHADHPGVAAEAAEAEFLGASHAAEHQALRKRQVRALRRWRKLPRAERRRMQAKQERRARLSAAAQTAEAGSEADIGRWTVAPFRLPNYAIHAALLPTGKVMFYGYPPIGPAGRPNEGRAALWDPKKGTGPESFTEVPPPVVDHDFDPATPAVPVPVFCSGQSLLPSGEVLITGGHLVEPTIPNDPYTNYAGHKMVVTFDPWSELWTMQPSMAKGRWYPSQTLLADGRTVITSGYTEDAPGKVLTGLVEEYTPAGTNGGQGSIGLLSGADRKVNLYPRMFLMPDGMVQMAGPGRYHVAKLNATTPGSGSWTGMSAFAKMTHDHWAGTAVQRSGAPGGSWEITAIGGAAGGVPADGNVSGTTLVETLDYRNPTAGWTPKPSLSIPRAHHNTVQLPDGSMVAIGGGLGSSRAKGNWAADPAGAQRQMELFDPATETWRPGASQVEDRTYHSVALQLPDGRVFSAGDDRNPEVNGSPASFDTAEIWTPPHHYQGERPRVRQHPEAVHSGDEFTVGADADAAAPAKAVLMAPAAVTHGVDMNARRVELEVTQAFDGEQIKLRAPSTPQIAPPGHYMLVLLTEDGIPSEASWIQLTSGNRGPVAVANADPAGGAAPLTVNFDGTDSSDPDGDPLTYAWDLDGDGLYDDSTSPTPTFTYTQDGNHVVRLRVSDDSATSGTATVTIIVGGNTKPLAQIDGPAPDLAWRVAQNIDFQGTGTDPEEGVLPASAFDWSLILHHCPSDCHEHSVQSFSDVKSGSFAAPDHGYPSHLALNLTVTDSAGLQDTDTVELDPRTVDVTMALAQPWFAPLSLTLNSETAPAPFTRPVIEGSTNTISAPTPQVGAGGRTYDFFRWWYLGNTQTRTLKVNAPTTYTAAYTRR